MQKNQIAIAAVAVIAVVAAGAYFLWPEPERQVIVTENSVDLDVLMEQGPLPDMVLGADDAPVTVVEYASMTCPHCGHFHETQYSLIKENYVDTGKVRFIFREFPLDRLALAGSMLARCVDDSQYFGFVGMLFDQQKTWVVEEPFPPLKTLARQAGLTEEAFDKCLANQELLDGLNWIRDRAGNDLGVEGTPTFFVNGERVRSAQVPNYDAFAEVIEKHLGG